MKVLIAGCNGHVGQEIVKKAISRGIDIRCFDLKPLRVPELDISSLDIVTGNITDLATVKGLQKTLMLLWM